ncbi:YybH family protein [Methanorbis rubei]|uniref:SnoaL-like domain-containing protein n=1 Tax=Methanorbis rubei TaxID=3028300 RepID=A0AAE4MGE5_9EURY|nr:hypothetical protein [Methanocorpusculaceae archaeon Cs1]
MPLSTQTKDQIISLLENYQTAYNQHDPKALAETLAQDIIMYGCRTEEIIQGRDAFLAMMEKNFARYKTGGIRFENPEVKGEGVIAWVSAACALQSITGSGAVHETPSRFTAVLRGTGHAWEIVQIHMSIGFPYRE